MIYKCLYCGRYIYPHDMKMEGVCPFCGCTELVKTDEDEQQEAKMSSVIPYCCLGCPNHPMNGGSATCAFCSHAVDGEPPEKQIMGIFDAPNKLPGAPEWDQYWDLEEDFVQITHPKRGEGPGDIYLLKGIFNDKTHYLMTLDNKYKVGDTVSFPTDPGHSEMRVDEIIQANMIDLPPEVRKLPEIQMI